ncbi:MAG: hypothetical protein R2854_20855 [Caldilineaceae bacterium]
MSGDLSEPARLVLAATPQAPAQPAVLAINTAALATPQAPGLVVVSGTAPPSSEVDLLLGDVVVGQTTADADGAWQYVLRLTQPGNYTVTALPRTGAGVATAQVNVDRTHRACPGRRCAHCDDYGERPRPSPARSLPARCRSRRRPSQEPWPLPPRHRPRPPPP